MTFLLLSHKKVQLKTQDKSIILINTIINDYAPYTIIMDYDEMLDAFCAHNKKEYITEYIDYRLSNKGIIPYIKYK